MPSVEGSVFNLLFLSLQYNSKFFLFLYSDGPLIYECHRENERTVRSSHVRHERDERQDTLYNNVIVAERHVSLDIMLQK